MRRTQPRLKRHSPVAGKHPSSAARLHLALEKRSHGGISATSAPRRALWRPQADGYVHDLAKCEEAEESNGAAAHHQHADEEEDDGDDEFDPYLFISTLPPLSSCVPEKRTPVLPRKARGSPRITLVRPGPAERRPRPATGPVPPAAPPALAPALGLRAAARPARGLPLPAAHPFCSQIRPPSGRISARAAAGASARSLPPPPRQSAGTSQPSALRYRAPPPTPPQVLDLDETLVHSTLDDKNASDFSFPVHFHNQTHTVNVRRRPHLETFMEHVGPRFEVVIFTASQRVYAERLLDIIDPEQKYFAHRIFRDSCVYVDGNYLKDLTARRRPPACTPRSRAADEPCLGLPLPPGCCPRRTQRGC